MFFIQTSIITHCMCKCEPFSSLNPSNPSVLQTPSTMCFNNLIKILTTTNTIKTTLRAKSPPLTNSQARSKIEFSKQDLTVLKHKHVNLTGLPVGTISTIRRLKLNNKKLGKPNTGNNSGKQE